MSTRGLAVAVMAGGALFLWSGIRGGGVLVNLQDLITGKPPASTGVNPIIPVITPAIAPGGPGGAPVNQPPPSAAGIAALKTYAQSLLVLHGWAGQFASFNSLVMSESGWNPLIANPNSGAWGIAQALGHGTPATDAGNGHNQYGNYGTSDAICRKANAGNGAAQLEWMTNYIARRYGNPDAAWAYHQANNSY